MVNLVSPVSRLPLTPVPEDAPEKWVDPAGNVFNRVGGVFRFVEGQGYASNFGFEWNKFSKTQVDRANGLNLSRERWFAQSGWKPESLSGKDILEVGSGAGRFTQVVLDHTEANLYSVDYSDAVTANFETNGHNKKLKLFQANIYALPFPAQSFDRVFCFGVLQHTPDVKKSVQCLAQMVKPGGELAVDFYPNNGWHTKIHIKYLLRPFLKKLNHETLLKLIDKSADPMIGMSEFFSKLGLWKWAGRVIPICDVEKTIPKNLSPSEKREWVILDTFDMFSPEYDQPQKIKDVSAWFEEFGLEVTFSGFVSYGPEKFLAPVVRGIKRG